mgnify:CR=1 FL=1|tara:strand:+ start:177545 stop:178054 length:510 start_codon:yes stop_codon:yes gene_type:complete
MENDTIVYTENSIRTYTGKPFDLKILDPDTICIEDIAHALSYTARYGGHLDKLFSVAQHSVLVARSVSKENRLAALLHDASEAYMGDMPSPFKIMMPEFKAIENKLMKVIADKFDFDFPLHPEIKLTDREYLHIEMDSFFEKNKGLTYWTPLYAKQQFLTDYIEYSTWN